MAQQLIFTSVPRGLRPNTRGFTTAAATASLTAPMMDRLEAMSGYTPVSAQEAPVAFSYQVARFGMQRIHILSRVSSAAADYSGRSNQIAHHLVVERTELPPGGAADVLLSGNLFHSSWVGEPQALPPVVLPRMESGPAPCAAWAKATGDAGWGGAMVRLLMGSATAPVFVVFQPGQEVLPLFAESLRLMPPARRGSVTFTTYASAQNADVECQVMGVAAGSALHQAALKTHPARVLDLAKMLVSPAPQDAFTEAARKGEMYQVAQVAPVKQVETKAAVVGAVKPPPMRGDFAPLMEDVEKGEPEWLALRRGPVPIRRKSKMGWVWAAVAGVLVLVGVGGILVMGKGEKKEEKGDVAVPMEKKPKVEEVPVAKKEEGKKAAVVAIAPKEDQKAKAARVAAVKAKADNDAVAEMKKQWEGKSITFDYINGVKDGIVVPKADKAFVRVIFKTAAGVEQPLDDPKFADIGPLLMGNDEIIYVKTEKPKGIQKDVDGFKKEFLIIPTANPVPKNDRPEKHLEWRDWRDQAEKMALAWDDLVKKFDSDEQKKWRKDRTFIGVLEYQTSTKGVVAPIPVDIFWEQLLGGESALCVGKDGKFDEDAWKKKFKREHPPVEDFGPCYEVRFEDLMSSNAVPLLTFLVGPILDQPYFWSKGEENPKPFPMEKVPDGAPSGKVSLGEGNKIKDNSECQAFSDVSLDAISQSRDSESQPGKNVASKFTVQLLGNKIKDTSLAAPLSKLGEAESLATGALENKTPEAWLKEAIDTQTKKKQSVDEIQKTIDKARNATPPKPFVALTEKKNTANKKLNEAIDNVKNAQKVKSAVDAMPAAITAWNTAHPANTRLIFYDKDKKPIANILFNLDPTEYLSKTYPTLAPYIKAKSK